jgi:hypothetical protein
MASARPAGGETAQIREVRVWDTSRVRCLDSTSSQSFIVWIVDCSCCRGRKCGNEHQTPREVRPLGRKLGRCVCSAILVCSNRGQNPGSLVTRGRTLDACGSGWCRRALGVDHCGRCWASAFGAKHLVVVHYGRVMVLVAFSGQGL